MDDINRAIRTNEQVIASTPEDLLGRAGYLNNLGDALRTRFEKTGAMDDINERLRRMNRLLHRHPKIIRIVPFTSALGERA